MNAIVGFGAPEPPPAEGLASWYIPGQTDGFGDRLFMFDNTDHDPLELLRFHAALVSIPGFEEAIHQRVHQFGRLTHAAFPVIRAVKRLESDGSLVLVSKYPSGRRLSAFLAERRPGKGLHPAFVTWVVSQIMQPLSILQAEGEEFAHGALTADRIILTSDGRVRVIEHVLGSALRHLDRSPAGLWNEFGVLVPTDQQGAHRVDARADVFQVGILALSMLLARQVTPKDLEQRLPALLDQWSHAATIRSRLFSDPLRLWLERTLQIGDSPYRSAAEAYADLRQLPSASAARAFELLQAPDLSSSATPLVAVQSAVSPSGPEAHMSDRFPSEEVEAGHSAAFTDAPRVVPAGGIADYGFPVESRTASDSRPSAPVSPEFKTEPIPDSPSPGLADSEFTLADVEFKGAARPGVLGRTGTPPVASREGVAMRRRGRGGVASSRRVLTLIAAGLAAVAVGEAIVIAMLFMRESPVAVPATELAASISSTVQSSPIDTGQESAPTILAAGLVADTGDQSAVPLPGTTADVGRPNVDASATAIARAAFNQRSGGVRLSAPIELKVLQGDRVLGSSADGPIVTTAGTHQLDLINTTFGFRSRRAVTFRAGEITTFEIAVPPGRLSVNAEPWAEVWIDNRPMGETPLANLEIPIGEHEVVFRHPDLGERRQNVIVRADAVTRASTTFDR